jgi:hypothetical protein
MDTNCSILAELKLKEIIEDKKINFNDNNAKEIWNLIKEFAKIRIKAKNQEIYCSSNYIFECGLSEENNLYLVILTRALIISWLETPFIKRIKEYVQFIYSFYPIERFMNFKGQIYSDDFKSTEQFFEAIESKDIFINHMNSKPIKIEYLVSDKLITNYK